MRFKATDDQVRQIMANAVNASSPMGMGFLHATNKLFSAEDFKDCALKPSGAHLDYVQGRMVKLYIRSIADGSWRISGAPPNGEYQSWVKEYPTYENLVTSVPGIELIPDVE